MPSCGLLTYLTSDFSVSCSTLLKSLGKGRKIFIWKKIVRKKLLNLRELSDSLFIFLFLWFLQTDFFALESRRCCKEWLLWKSWKTCRMSFLCQFVTSMGFTKLRFLCIRNEQCFLDGCFLHEFYRLHLYLRVLNIRCLCDCCVWMRHRNQIGTCHLNDCTA